MLNIFKKYRNTYFSENIITERVYENLQWNNTVETVQNAVLNNQISNQAVVFGNGIGRDRFDINLIMNHTGGLLGSKTLQTYGCNAMYRDHAVDFLVATDRDIAQEIVNSGYCQKHIVYTRVLNTLEFPRNFYLIPNDPYADAGTTALYIACFDGHAKIFLLGFEGQDTPGYNYNVYSDSNGYDATEAPVEQAKWIANQARVFSIFNDVDFVIVSEAGRTPLPTSWKYLTNVRQINFRDFVLEADL